MTEIHIAHSLPPDDVEARMRALAKRHDIEMTVTEPGARGELSKQVAFLGSVEALYEIRPAAVVIEVSKAPGALQGTLRRTLEDELSRALA